MTIEPTLSENEKEEKNKEVGNEHVANANPLYALQAIKGVLTEDEELTFMNIMFSSSASVRSGNFGLSRREVEKQLNIQGDEEKFYSFLTRVNQAVPRYFQLIYDDRRDQVVFMMRVPARTARSTLNKESLSILLYIFYQQEVLQHEFTTLDQLLDAFGHETTKANTRILANIDPLKKIGAIEEYDTTSQEKAYQLTAIGVNMFSDSFLRRTVEFSQSTQLNKEEVLKFFRRYNYIQKGDQE
ncbi:hypothetical protein [Bacillus sp. Marseille-P3661]|uniref:hypothetical protein n=1 Tax=Bacillus sp. Marseille-P3661 TaxID=1936234 RepID=UPI0021550DAD|nr:hypothetical protein [Bacillus sp. Marseille-P3661]